MWTTNQKRLKEAKKWKSVKLYLFYLQRLWWHPFWRQGAAPEETRMDPQKVIQLIRSPSSSRRQRFTISLKIWLRYIRKRQVLKLRYGRFQEMIIIRIWKLTCQVNPVLQYSPFPLLQRLKKCPLIWKISETWSLLTRLTMILSLRAVIPSSGFRWQRKVLDLYTTPIW